MVPMVGAAGKFWTELIHTPRKNAKSACPRREPLRGGGVWVPGHRRDPPLLKKKPDWYTKCAASIVGSLIKVALGFDKNEAWVDRTYYFYWRCYCYQFVLTLLSLVYGLFGF